MCTGQPSEHMLALEHGDCETEISQTRLPQSELSTREESSFGDQEAASQNSNPASSCRPCPDLLNMVTLDQQEPLRVRFDGTSALNGFSSSCEPSETQDRRTESLDLLPTEPPPVQAPYDHWQFMRTVSEPFVGAAY